MSKVYVTAPILEAINKIAQAGHGVELEMGGGGNSHTVTYITIGCRRPGVAGYTKKLVIRHTSSYSQRFSDFSGVSHEFGELCYGYSSIDELIAAANRLA